MLRCLLFCPFFLFLGSCKLGSDNLEVALFCGLILALLVLMGFLPRLLIGLLLDGLKVYVLFSFGFLYGAGLGFKCLLFCLVLFVSHCISSFLNFPILLKVNVFLSISLFSFFQ